MSMKRCNKCKQEKPLDEYHRDRSKRDGLRYMCKACKRAYDIANRERIKEKRRAYMAANPERVKKTNRAWAKANPERVAKTNRAASARMRVKYPERIAARNVVNNAVKLGKLPAASTQVCVACGDDAQNWHHHLGYEREHWLDVVAVCVPCHVELDKETS